MVAVEVIALAGGAGAAIGDVDLRPLLEVAKDNAVARISGRCDHGCKRRAVHSHNTGVGCAVIAAHPRLELEVHAPPFAQEADIPATWECKFDGTIGKLIGGHEPETKKNKPARTHWDMLLERRSLDHMHE